ncbi:MAG: hypothetical protein IKS28_07795 [Clostridia bacterium]|nr:hypothetical protein [Clostridia bacterium]
MQKQLYAEVSQYMRKHISVLLAIAIVVSMFTAGFITRSYAEETTVTIVTADLGYANEDAVAEVSQGGVTITFDKGSGTNDPKYYTSGTAIRVYANNTVTFAASAPITAIKVTYSAEGFVGNFSADSGTYTLNDTVATWTGSANSVVWTNNITKSNARFQQIEVTFSGAGGTEPSPTATSTGSTAPTDPGDILDALYALGDNDALEGKYTLTGKITSVDTAYNSQFKNITVTIVVDGYDDKPVKCYRLKGDGVDALKVNDVITVEGALKKYKGTPEFDEGCELKSVVPAPTESAEPQPTPSTPEEILNALYALGKNEAMEGEYTLAGTITSVDTAYSEQHHNITVTIVVDGYPDKPVKCYRLAGEGADKLKVNDVITVKGKLKNYNGTPEFDAACQLLAVVPASDPEPTGTSEPQPTPSTAEEILTALYALEAGQKMEGTYTLSGVITQVNTPYNAQYKDVTVTIVVGDFTDKPVMCYCLKGEGVDTLKVGDSITVSGALKRYNDTREFDKDCQLVSIDARGEAQTEDKPEYNTPEEIVNAVYALEPGAFLDGNYTLTGVIRSVDTEFNPKYNNVTVTIVVGNMTDKPIMCYRLAGDGADSIAVGDTITVSGLLKKYHKDGQPDICEFDSGCSLDKVVKAQQPQPGTGDLAVTSFAALLVLALSAALVLRRKKA